MAVAIAFPSSTLHRTTSAPPTLDIDQDADLDYAPNGPPPPSPPASVERERDVDFPPVQSQVPPPPSKDIRNRVLVEQKATTRTTQRPPRPSLHSDSSQDSHDTITPSNYKVSQDSYLQPPAGSSSLPAKPRPTRRNTTGSAPRPPRSMHAQHASTAMISTSVPSQDASAPLAGVVTPDPELDTDIMMQADQIRRERMSKRKAQAKAQADELTRVATKEGVIALSSDVGAEKQVLVGNLIGEGHVNYVLMYNMLTGIRIGVSRCQAKVKRDLTADDFVAQHKYTFDIVGNELTPSAKYDFKFKDYAPWVFRLLREDCFGLDPADYLLSLTAKYILSELGSPGKSGSFFYFSRDYRFIIKTIHISEKRWLLARLKDYWEYVKANPHTLVSRFYGLHRVKLPHGRKIHFVIMNNLFPAHRDIHETYDLKGSTIGRLYPEEKLKTHPRATLKDLNWIYRGRQLELGPEKRALLTEQLRRDTEFLKKMGVMDYSLLVGVHEMRRGNREGVRRGTLKVFEPKIRHHRTEAVRRIMRVSDIKALGEVEGGGLPEEDVDHRQQFIFYQDEGGLRATSEDNTALDRIYYLGVIDILTPYTALKRLEGCWKGLRAGRDRMKISPLNPDEYGSRFFAFMKAIMRGGGGADKFKPREKGSEHAHGESEKGKGVEVPQESRKDQ